MRIIITGAAGFIGAHTSRSLMLLGHEVVGVDNFSHFHPRVMKMRRWESLSEGFNPLMYEIDIADGELFSDLVRSTKPDAIMHLAAQAGVRYSIKHPERCLRSNVIGSYKVFEAASRHDIPRVVYASSSSVYGKLTGECREDDLGVVPLSVYGASKRSGEIIARSMWESNGLRTVGTRFFTAYGEWGRPDMSYFRMLISAYTGAEFPLLADLEVRRDFTYVADTVNVLTALIERADTFDDPSLVVNVGGGTPCTLSTLLETIESVTGRTVMCRKAEATPGDVQHTEASTELIRSLGLPLPKTTVREGIERTVKWIEPLINEASGWVDWNS